MIPTRPFGGSSFELHDCWTATDVSAGGRKVTAVATCGCTNYSKETFDSTDHFRVVVRVHALKGGSVHVGVIDDSAEGCRNYRVGEKEVPNSLGCFIEDGEVRLVRDDKIFFRGDCDTRDPTDIKMYFVRGEVRFGIDNGLVNSDELKALTFKGDFRLGVSMTKAGQVAEIVTVEPQSKLPNGEGGGGSGGGKQELLLKLLQGLQQLSEGHGDSSPSKRKPLLPVGTRVRRNPSDWKWGDQDGNGPGSVVQVKDGGILRVKWDNGHSNDYRWGHSDAYDLKRIDGGIVRGTRVRRNPSDWKWGDQDGNGAGTVVNVKGEWLTVKWDCGKQNDYRCGADGAHDVLEAPDAPVAITLRDNYRSTDVDRSGRRVKCVKDFNSTNVSEQVFSAGSGGLTVAVTLPRVRGRRVHLGLVPADTDNCARFTCGEKEIEGSVAVFVHGTKVGLLESDSVKGTTEHDTDGRTHLAMTLEADGTLKFSIDGASLPFEALKSRRFEASYHVGVSTTAVGQAAEITYFGPPHHTRAMSLGAVPSDAGRVRAPGAEFTWQRGFAGGAAASLAGGVATATEGGDIAAVFEALQPSCAIRGFTCSGCRKGSTDFRGGMYHCTKCADFDFCAKCYAAKHSSHEHGAAEFVFVPGGEGFVELPVLVSANGAPFDVLVYDHYDHREAPERATVHGDGVVRVRVFAKRVLVMRGDAEVLMKVAEPEAAAHKATRRRFAIRFSAAGQRATLQRAWAGPSAGDGVALPRDASVVEAACDASPRLAMEQSMVGLRGTVVQTDDDGTVEVQSADKSVTWWVPTWLAKPENATSPEKPKVVPSPGPKPHPQPTPAPGPDVGAVRASHAHVMDTRTLPAVRLKASYAPPTGAAFVESLKALAGVMPAVEEMETVVAESARIAADRVARMPGELSHDEALALAMYTFDLQALSDTEDGSDNFFFQLNEALRVREQGAMAALRPFLYHFRQALEKLPRVSGVVTYRGVPPSARATVQREYAPGKTVHWTALTSVSEDAAVAQRFSGPQGVVFKISVVEAYNVALYSAVGTGERELVLLPNAQFTTTGLDDVPGAHLLSTLQQVAPDAKFVF